MCSFNCSPFLHTAQIDCRHKGRSSFLHCFLCWNFWNFFRMGKILAIWVLYYTSQYRGKSILLACIFTGCVKCHYERSPHNDLNSDVEPFSSHACAQCLHRSVGEWSFSPKDTQRAEAWQNAAEPHHSRANQTETVWAVETPPWCSFALHPHSRRAAG